MYGGRAIDSFDRRILTVYMDEYLGDFIFDTFQTFHFYKNDEVDYRIPQGTVKDDFVGKQCFLLCKLAINKRTLLALYVLW